MKTHDQKYEEAVARNLGNATQHVKRGGLMGYTVYTLPNEDVLKYRFGIRKRDGRFDTEVTQLHKTLKERMEARREKAAVPKPTKQATEADKPVKKVREKKERKRAG